MTLRLASRQSALAIQQTQQVARAISARLGLDTEIIGISTRGDRYTDRPLAAIGGKELFIRELQQALRRGQADAAVHSLKDMAAQASPELTLAAIGFAQPAHDVLLGTVPLAELAAGSRVGTSSPRRTAMLQQYYPHLVAHPLRGNVPTRLKKWHDGDCDALILAAAGLMRLNLQSQISAPLPVTQFVPAAGQGLLAIECLAANTTLITQLGALNDAKMQRRATAERTFIAAMAGDCTTPLAAYAQVGDDNSMTLSVFFADASGRCHTTTVCAPCPQDAGEHAAAIVRRAAGLH